MLKRSNLYEYQERVVRFVRDNPFCAIWLDCGLGKTVSVLTAILEMINEFEVSKVLVVAPLLVAEKTWKDEMSEWCHLRGLKPAFILGTSPKKRLAGWRKGYEEDADIYFINRENIAWLVDQHIDSSVSPPKQFRRWLWDMVVLDESSSYKNDQAKRFKALKLARRLFDRCIQLTGTPAPKGLADLWAQMYLLDRGKRLGHAIGDFRKRWFDYDAFTERWEPRPFAEDDIKDKLKDIVVSMRAEDYLELPPVLKNYIRVEMSEIERRKYLKMRKTMITEISGKKITAVNAGVLFGKLLQMSNGAVYHDREGKWTLLHDHKIKALQTTLESVSGPTMIAYNYKSDLARIRKLLNKTDLRYMHIKEKGALDAWDSGKLDVLIFHPASAGHGLNLHKCGCKDLIWFGLNPSLELYMQANARLTGGHRRAEGVRIHHIICDNSQDSNVVDILERRDNQQRRIVDAVKLMVEEHARAA